MQNICEITPAIALIVESIQSVLDHAIRDPIQWDLSAPPAWLSWLCGMLLLALIGFIVGWGIWRGFIKSCPACGRRGGHKKEGFNARRTEVYFRCPTCGYAWFERAYFPV